LRLYFSEIRTDHVQEGEANRFFNSMAASQGLEDIQIDRRR
jgi:hypothetical protein